MDQQVIFLIVAVVLFGVLMFLPQWQARRRRQKQMAELNVGDEVITIGGIVGKLTYLNGDENRARIEIAPGIEMQVLLSAINRSASVPEQRTGA